MKRLASVISKKVERIPTYLDARLKQTETMAKPSSLGFLQKLDLLPETPRAIPTAVPMAAAPPIEVAEKPAEGFFDKLGKLTEVAAPVAALMGEPEAAAAVTVIDEAVAKLQTVLAKPKADKSGKDETARSEAAKASSETVTKQSPPTRSRVEEVGAGDEASSAAPATTPAVNESGGANEMPDRSPQAWAERIRKMIEAETGAVGPKLPQTPLVSIAQTPLVEAAENIGNVSTTLTAATPPIASVSAALPTFVGLDEAGRFIAPIAGNDSLPQSVQQPIGQAVQRATAAIPFSMRTATNVEAGIESNISNFIAPMTETIESPAAQINQQLNQAGNQLLHQATNPATGAFQLATQQATSLVLPAAESVAGFAGSITPRFVPPIVNATLPASTQRTISPSALPNGVESLANGAIQSAARSGLVATTSGASNEGLAGAVGSLFGQAEEPIKSSMSSPVETLEQWAANPVAGFSGLFGQAEQSPTTPQKSNRTEVTAARGDDNSDKMKTATRATAAQVAPDLDDIARQVYPILKRRLDAERRREFF